MNVKYNIENEVVQLQLDGKTFVGKPENLLMQDVNLLSDLEWENTGFTVEKFLSESDMEIIREGMKQKVKQMINEVGGNTDENFSLDKYHEYVNDEVHLKITKLFATGWHINEFPIAFEKVNERISSIIKKTVTAEAKHVNMYNFFLRIVRPHCFQDNNPPHRDVWLDRLRNAINIYVPICGSDINSSLPLIAGSHKALESELERTADGALLDGTRYTVPCVISYKGEAPKMIRPDVAADEVMVFSPYLVHGGGYNFNPEATRMSLEVRFWDQSKSMKSE